MTLLPGSMNKKIAEKQLEAKRIEDAQLRQLEDPNYRGDSDLREVRAFKEAAAEIYGGGGSSSSSSSKGRLALGGKGGAKGKPKATTHHVAVYDPRLARYYMVWPLDKTPLLCVTCP